MKNYLQANFRSLGQMKLANISPIHANLQSAVFLPKNIKNCFLHTFLGKITSPQIVFFSNFQFLLLFDPAYSTVHSTPCKTLHWVLHRSTLRVLYGFLHGIGKEHKNVLSTHFLRVEIKSGGQWYMYIVHYCV